MIFQLENQHYSTAKAVAERRQAAALEKHRPSAHGYGESDPLGVHLLGAVAEIGISLVLREYWHAFLEKLGDGDRKPPDVGKNIQVRATEYKRGHLIVHPSDHDSDVFVLVLVAGQTIQIRGWLLGSEAKLPKYWGDKMRNGRPAFWIPQSDLRNVESLLALFPGAPFYGA